MDLMNLKALFKSRRKWPLKYEPFIAKVKTLALMYMKETLINIVQ